jgi:asparagine synthase (glutamine-hydrolysing)
LLDKVANRVSLYAGMGLFELYLVIKNGLPYASRVKFRECLEIPDDYDDYWHLRESYLPQLGPRKSLQYLDFHTYLPDDILTKVDRASMACSLECRVPFLARDVVEFAFSLPEEFLYLDGLKGGLKFAYRSVLPGEILCRAKKGFGIPAAAWQLLGDDETFEVGVLRYYMRSQGYALSRFLRAETKASAKLKL